MDDQFPAYIPAYIALVVHIVVVCGIILLSERKQHREMPSFRAVLALVAKLCAFVLLCFAVSDVLNNSTASKWSWLLILVFLAFMGIVFYGLHSNAQANERRQKEYWIFEFGKNGNGFVTLGVQITDFLSAYNMSKEEFENLILRPAIRQAMDDYCSSHPPEPQEE